MPVWLLVALGGAVGSVARYYLSVWSAQRMGAWGADSVTAAAAGTLGINVLGSFVLGAIATFALTRATVITPEMRLLLGVGLCGGFTTFSTFTLEAWSFVQRGQYGAAAIYMAASCGLGLVAVISGSYLARLAG